MDWRELLNVCLNFGKNDDKILNLEFFSSYSVQRLRGVAALGNTR